MHFDTMRNLADNSYRAFKKLGNFEFFIEIIYCERPCTGVTAINLRENVACIGTIDQTPIKLVAERVSFFTFIMKDPVFTS